MDWNGPAGWKYLWKLEILFVSPAAMARIMGVKGARITEIFKSLQRTFDKSQFQVSEAVLTANVQMWRVSVTVRANAQLRSTSQVPHNHLLDSTLESSSSCGELKHRLKIPPNQLSGWTALLQRACEAVWSNTAAQTLCKPNGITGSFSSTLRLFDRFSPVSRQMAIPNCLYLFKAKRPQMIQTSISTSACWALGRVFDDRSNMGGISSHPNNHFTSHYKTFSASNASK